MIIVNVHNHSPENHFRKMRESNLFLDILPALNKTSFKLKVGMQLGDFSHIRDVGIRASTRRQEKRARDTGGDVRDDANQGGSQCLYNNVTEHVDEPVCTPKPLTPSCYLKSALKNGYL